MIRADVARADSLRQKGRRRDVFVQPIARRRSFLAPTGRPEGPETRRHQDRAFGSSSAASSANFTGIATTDIPSTSGPGFAIVNNPNPLVINNPQLAAAIKVSGFAIDAIRMQYDPTDDTLSVAIQQPLNQKTNPQFPVIAGDADNNQNSGGTPGAAVLAAAPLFQDYYNLGGSETMAVFFDFNKDGIPDVVAGVPNTPGAGKLFTVNQAVVSSDPQQAATTAPSFGTPLPNNTGYAFLRNSVTQPAFEFTITNFSKLYEAETGQPFTAQTTMKVGAFAGSNSDFINEEYVPAQTVSFRDRPHAPTRACLSSRVPQIQINPHQNRHVNTAHPELVRVSIFGTSGFDVNSILPNTVTLGGAKPLAHFTRHINHDQFEDVTYVFRGDQISLPRGITAGTVSGQYVDSQGQTENFLSAQTIYNKDASFYSPAQRAIQQHRQEVRGVAPTFPSPAVARRAHEHHVDLVIDQSANQQTLSNWTGTGNTVSIPTSGQVQVASVASNAPAPTGPLAKAKARHQARVQAASAPAASVFPDVKAMLRQQRVASRVSQVSYLNTPAPATPTVSAASVAPTSGNLPKSAA